jgi:citrate synthase
VGNKRKLSTGAASDFEYPVLSGSVGPDVVDIRKLYGQTGMFTYDPGFTSTASCESALTYIDGDEGVLLHRGYPIGQLAEHSSFMEVCYLLLNGELPSQAELAEFSTRSPATPCCTNSLPPSIAVSAAMRTRWRSCAAWSARFRRSITIRPTSPIPSSARSASHRLIAKMPTIAAMAYKYSVGQPFVYPDNSLSYTGNFLRMTFGVPAEEYEVNPGGRKGDGPHLHPPCRPRAERFDLDRPPGRFIGCQPVCLHRRGHRLPVGPGAWRRQRSGAQHAASEIGTPDRIPHYIERAKDKNDPFRLMGFGHRVYKNYDPRATVMQKPCARCSRR